MRHKPIAIIDCFVHTQSVESKLSACLDRLAAQGIKTMLVTNTPVEKSISEKLDHLLYDKENRLFDDTMDAKHISLVKTLQGMRVVEVVKGTQRHGLSVLRNLTKALRTAKAYGYTHFHRLEVDDLMGQDSMSFLSGVPDMVADSERSGLFFLNDNPDESNISFHYMYCEIELFLNSVSEIDTQQDYQFYLKNEMLTNTFVNVEEFVRHNINKVIDNLITLPGTQMQNFFTDTVWNTETSQSNLESKYRNCTSRIYRTIHNGQEAEYNILLTYNYGNTEKKRQIELIRGTGVLGTVNHHVHGHGCWQTSHIGKDIDVIRVIEDGKEIYTEGVWSNYSAQHIELI